MINPSFISFIPVDLVIRRMPLVQLSFEKLEPFQTESIHLRWRQQKSASLLSYRHECHSIWYSARESIPLFEFVNFCMQLAMETSVAPRWGPWEIRKPLPWTHTPHCWHQDICTHTHTFMQSLQWQTDAKQTSAEWEEVDGVFNSALM